MPLNPLDVICFTGNIVAFVRRRC